MFIKKLEVQGFKSFADRTKILFHPGITAIVGPNGTARAISLMPSCGGWVA
jgi:chromosome segregation protein